MRSWAWEAGLTTTRVAELAAAAQAGDRDAFTQLYRCYAPAVGRFFGARLSNPEDVEDLVQETFTDAWAQLGTYRAERAPFRAWLIGRARGALLHYRWARWRHLGAVQGATRVLREQLRDDASGIPHNGVVAPGLAAAVEALAPHKRRCVQLRYVEGLSVQSVAELVGVQPSSVRAEASHAMADLRRIFTPGGEAA
jgi:RNA polymerase sigma-70 factor, ECF subfamily